MNLEDFFEMRSRITDANVAQNGRPVKISLDNRTSKGHEILVPIALWPRYSQVYGSNSQRGEKHLVLESKRDRLRAVYDRFEEEAAEFRSAAVCEPGCAFCCTDMGRVDITTLEGLLIREQIGKLKRPQAAALTKALNRDIRKREKGLKNQCPFLQKNRRCLIYTSRPFSCRQLYSLKRCGEQGPTVHRQVVARARTAVAQLHAIDDTGYSGHMSYILHMLGSEKFRRVYHSGAFRPEEVMAFGESHQIVINRMMAGGKP